MCAPFDAAMTQSYGPSSKPGVVGRMEIVIGADVDGAALAPVLKVADRRWSQCRRVFGAISQPV